MLGKRGSIQARNARAPGAIGHRPRISLGQRQDGVIDLARRVFEVTPTELLREIID